MWKPWKSGFQPFNASKIPLENLWKKALFSSFFPRGRSVNRIFERHIKKNFAFWVAVSCHPKGKTVRQDQSKFTLVTTFPSFPQGMEKRLWKRKAR